MLQLVASTPNYSLANDCTYDGLEDDVITERFKIERRHMLVPQGPGLGINIDVERGSTKPEFQVLISEFKS